MDTLHITEKEIEEYVSSNTIRSTFGVLDLDSWTSIQTLEEVDSAIKDSIAALEMKRKKLPSPSDVRKEIKRVCADINKLIDDNAKLVTDFIKLSAPLNADGTINKEYSLQKADDMRDKIEKLFSSIDYGSLIFREPSVYCILYDKRFSH